MATVNVTKDGFEQLISGNDTVLIDFWASWCGPCRMFGPIYEEVAQAHPDLVFAKVDTEAEQELAGALGIQSIPTLMVFREEVLLFSQAGALPQPVLEDLISQVQNLDMEEVHRKVAEHQADADTAAHNGHVPADRARHTA